MKVNMKEIGRSIIFFTIFIFICISDVGMTTLNEAINYIILLAVVGWFFINSMSKTINYSDNS